MRRTSLLPFAFCLLLLLIGFALRLTLIEKRPLHFDEGINVYFAPLALPELLQAHIANADTDPPAHRMTLGWFAQGAGLWPFSIRLYSVFFSTLSIALLYRVMRQLKLPPITCVFAVVLMTLSPYAIYYAQEAKGYALGAGMALASWSAWISLGKAEGRRQKAKSRYAALFCLLPFTFYLLSTALMLGTHFYTAPVLGMQWVWWFLTRKQRTLRDVFGRLGLQAAACVPVGIWSVLALPSVIAGSLGVSNDMPTLSLFNLAQLIFGEMSVSRPANEPSNVLAAVVFGLSLLAGGAFLWRHNKDAFWFGAACLVPLLFTLLLTRRVSFFSPRFLLYALPNLLVLTSGLLLQTSANKPGFFKKPGLFARPAPVFLVFCSGLITFYQSDLVQISDYRPMLVQMRPMVKQGDGALGTYIWMRGMMTSYAPDAAEKLTWHEDFANAQNAEAALSPIAQSHRRLWLFNFARDPDSLDTASAKWLRENWAYADRFAAGDMSVLLFAEASIPRPDHPQTNTFDHRIGLHWELPCTTVKLEGISRNEAAKPPEPEQPEQVATCVVWPGDVFVLPTEWTALAPITDDLAISLQLIDANGQLVAQNDGSAVNGLAPSFTWQPNQPVLDRRALLIPSTLAPGQYTVRLGIYRRSDGARLKNEEGEEFVPLAAVRVDPRR